MYVPADMLNVSAMLLTCAIIATRSLSLLTADPTPCKINKIMSATQLTNLMHYKRYLLHTTPAAPALIAIGAVTALSPDEHKTGILTALEIEYAAASVGVACNIIISKENKSQLVTAYVIMMVTFSIRPITPDFEGEEHFPPSVWITSTPSSSSISASFACFIHTIHVCKHEISVFKHKFLIHWLIRRSTK